MKKRRIAAYFVAANAIGIFFLWLAARGLPFEQIGPYLETVSLSRLLGWSTVFVGVYSICHYARVVRWNYLVRPLGEVDTRQVNRASAVGFAAILLLPLRLGELVRPSVLANRTDLSLSSLLATAVVERVLDGLLVTGLLFLTLVTYSGAEQETYTLELYSGLQFELTFQVVLGLIAAAIFIPALVVCGLALWRRRWAFGIIEFVGRPISPTLTERAIDILDDFIDGFGVLSQTGTLGRFVGVTLIYWMVNILSLWLLARFGFGFDLALSDAATVIAILVVGIMIPAGPGLTGNFEFFLKKGLELFVSIEAVGGKAALFVPLVHVLQFLVIVMPGFWVMWTDPAARHLLELTEQAREEVDPDESDPPSETSSDT
jgi:uncharacterized protein (TIRG00374 family)